MSAREYPSEMWDMHMESMWRIEDPSDTVEGYLIRDGLPRDLGGGPFAGFALLLCKGFDHANAGNGVSQNALGMV